MRVGGYLEHRWDAHLRHAAADLDRERRGAVSVAVPLGLVPRARRVADLQQGKRALAEEAFLQLITVHPNSPSAQDNLRLVRKQRAVNVI